jgi:predicted dithiol-disulfide oxidoreductase (DUF899 family)
MTMAARTLSPPKVVSRDEWLSARKALFVKEKEMTHKLDELRKERRHLPWVKIDKPYVFEGPNGKCTLADLFQSRSQLAIYHFMLNAGLPSRLQRVLFRRRSFRRGAQAL